MEKEKARGRRRRTKMVPVGLPNISITTRVTKGGGRGGGKKRKEEEDGGGGDQRINRCSLSVLHV